MPVPAAGGTGVAGIGLGGVLGMGEKQVSVPWSSVKVGQDGGKVVVVTEQKLLEQAEQAPKAERDDRGVVREDETDSRRPPGTIERPAPPPGGRPDLEKKTDNEDEAHDRSS